LLRGAVSLACSSWTTAGTVGVGLIGGAGVTGVSPAITAGVIVSGAYLGDEVSSLSETTVLAAQLAEVGLHTHIRAMIWTAGPAFLIALVVFAILGITGSISVSAHYLAMGLHKVYVPDCHPGIGITRRYYGCSPPTSGRVRVCR